MQVQYYKHKAHLEHIEKAKPGQPVYLDDDSGEEPAEIIGFIEFVSDCEVCVLFFEPVEFPDSFADDITQLEFDGDWESKLIAVLTEFPDQEVSNEWIESLGLTVPPG